MTLLPRRIKRTTNTTFSSFHDLDVSPRAFEILGTGLNVRVFIELYWFDQLIVSS